MPQLSQLFCISLVSSILFVEIESQCRIFAFYWLKGECNLTEIYLEGIFFFLLCSSMSRPNRYTSSTVMWSCEPYTTDEGHERSSVGIQISMPLLNAITPLALYSWKEGEDKNSSQKIKAINRDIRKKWLKKGLNFRSFTCSTSNSFHMSSSHF